MRRVSECVTISFSRASMIIQNIVAILWFCEIIGVAFIHVAECTSC